MIKLFAAIRKNYFDNTVDLSKLSKTFSLWAIGLAFVYVTNVYITKLIGLELYGKYAVFFSWVSLISTLLTFGWEGYLIQKIPQLPRNKQGKITRTSLLGKSITSFLTLFTLFGVLIIWTASSQKKSFGFLETDQVLIFLLIVFLFALITLLKSFLKIFHVVFKIQWAEDVLKPLILFTTILVYYSYQVKLSLSSLYIINLLLFGGLAISLLFYSIRIYRENFGAGDASVITDKWVSKCFYFMCIYLGYSIFSRMELLFLGYFAKNEEAAKYQILLRISDLVLIPDFLFNYFLPQKFSYAFANNKITDAKALFRNASRTILLLQLICLTGIMMIGYWYLLSFNIDSSAMYILLVIMCCAPLFYSLFGTSNLVLKTSGNERYAFYALLIVLVLEGIANYVFILPYGLTAAVIISWMSIFLYTLILAFFLYKKTGFSNRVTGFLFSVGNKSKSG